MVFFFWILNFVISGANAWGCGKSWTETKHNGGLPHFMNWMGAVMSASGFTWCYTIIGCFFGSHFHHTVNGQEVPYLSEAAVTAVASGGYLVVIFPILGSGLAIGIHSWMVFWRRRTLANGLTAGYNTFADVYNMYSAVEGIPMASKGFFGFLKGDSDEKGKLIVVAIVVAAAFAGILTTYTILTTTARSTAMNRAFKYAGA